MFVTQEIFIVLFVAHTPASQKNRCQKDWEKYDFFKNFSLIGCRDKGTPEDESEPVDSNTQSEESLAKMNKEGDKALEDAEPIPILWQSNDKHDDMEVTKT